MERGIPCPAQHLPGRCRLLAPGNLAGVDAQAPGSAADAGKGGGVLKMQRLILPRVKVIGFADVAKQNASPALIPRAQAADADSWTFSSVFSLREIKNSPQSEWKRYRGKM